MPPPDDVEIRPLIQLTAGEENRSVWRVNRLLETKITRRFGLVEGLYRLESPPAPDSPLKAHLPGIVTNSRRDNNDHSLRSLPALLAVVLDSLVCTVLLPYFPFQLPIPLNFDYQQHRLWTRLVRTFDRKRENMRLKLPSTKGLRAAPPGPTCTVSPRHRTKRPAR